MVWNQNYYVYMMCNKHNTVFYTGYTNDLSRRAYEHRSGEIDGFTKKYQLFKLVYWEHYSDEHAARRREKQIKGLTRAKKIALIEKENSDYDDLFDSL